MLLANMLPPDNRAALKTLRDEIADHEKATNTQPVAYWSRSGQEWRLARCQRDISNEDRAGFWEIDEMLLRHLPETRP